MSNDTSGDDPNSGNNSLLAQPKEIAPSADFAASSAATSSNSASSDFRFRLSGWTRLAILASVISLASIGYLSSSLRHEAQPAKIHLAELDPEELAKRPVVSNFTVPDAEGHPHKLSDYRGQVVILSFWASWCTPCLVELPTFAEIQKKFESQGLRVLAVNIDEGDEGKDFAKDFWTNKKFPFPTFFDTSKALARQFEVDILPANFVIDRQGRLVFSGYGANDWGGTSTTEFIEGLLAESEKDPATDDTAASGMANSNNP